MTAGKKRPARHDAPFPNATALTDDDWARLQALLDGTGPGLAPATPAPPSGNGPGARPAPEDATPQLPRWPAQHLPVERDSPTTAAESPPPVVPVVAPEEWREHFFQRGAVTGLATADGALVLSATDATGQMSSITLRGEALRAVNAVALHLDGHGLDRQDHDDLVLAAMLLRWYADGLPLQERPEAVQAAVGPLLDRLPLFMARLAGLLPAP